MPQTLNTCTCTHVVTWRSQALNRQNHPTGSAPPPRSIVVRVSARGAGGQGSIPDRVTLEGLRFSAWRLASDWAAQFQYKWSE